MTSSVKPFRREGDCDSRGGRCDVCIEDQTRGFGREGWRATRAGIKQLKIEDSLSEKCSRSSNHAKIPAIPPRGRRKDGEGSKQRVWKKRGAEDPVTVYFVAEEGKAQGRWKEVVKRGPAVGERNVWTSVWRSAEVETGRSTPDIVRGATFGGTMTGLHGLTVEVVVKGLQAFFRKGGGIGEKKGRIRGGKIAFH